MLLFLPVNTEVLFFAFCCGNQHLRWISTHHVCQSGGQTCFLVVFHAILRQISIYCFCACAISLRQLSVCAIFLHFFSTRVIMDESIVVTES